MLEFKDRLRSAMGEMSNSELSKRSGIGESTIRSYLVGKAMPRPEKLHKLADALGVNINWLWVGVGDPKPADQPPKIDLSYLDENPSELVAIDSTRERIATYMAGVADYIERAANLMESGGWVDIDRVISEVNAWEELASKIEVDPGVSLLNFINAEQDVDKAWPDAPKDKKAKVMDIIKKQIRANGKAPDYEIVEAICYLAK